MSAKQYDLFRFRDRIEKTLSCYGLDLNAIVRELIIERMKSISFIIPADLYMSIPILSNRSKYYRQKSCQCL